MSSLDTVINELTELERQIESAETQLKLLKTRRQEILQRILPELMAEHGVVKWETPDYVLTLSEYVSGSLPKEPEAKERAIQTLERIGGGSIIKANVLAKLPKGELETARRIAQQIAGQGWPVSLDVGVHPQTLHAFIRERLRAGEPVPADELGVQVGQIVKVRRK